MLGALGALQIIESTAACTYVRNRTYAKRRARSPRHWARMDKKWLKRYGTHAVPHAYVMDTSYLTAGLFGRGNGRQVLVVHPSLAAEYRKAITQVFEQAPIGENCI